MYKHTKGTSAHFFPLHETKRYSSCVFSNWSSPSGQFSSRYCKTSTSRTSFNSIFCTKEDRLVMQLNSWFCALVSFSSYSSYSTAFSWQQKLSNSSSSDPASSLESSLASHLSPLFGSNMYGSITCFLPPKSSLLSSVGSEAVVHCVCSENNNPGCDVTHIFHQNANLFEIVSRWRTKHNSRV